MRVLQSCGASAVLSVGAGSISDIFESDESGRAYGMFYAIPLLSFLIGTIVGGYITQYYGWHWIFWSLSIFGGILFFFILFALPETFHQSSFQLSDNEANQNSLMTPRKHFNPFSPLCLFRHFKVTLTLIYFGLTITIVYAQDVLIAKIFTNLYNLSASKVGFVFLAQGAGYVVGSLIGGHYSDFILKREKKNNGGVSYPEMCLKDLFPDYSTLVIATVNLVRIAFASIMTVSAASLQDALGIGYMYTVLVGITALGSGCLVLVYSKEKMQIKNLASKRIISGGTYFTDILA
ncbi:42835_t:CDS:2 [Gigaspora margarita]|uniref:42835_t:CDS:1 n=1 Tax=Gigaspora margarita TaxID=4874 RepID=A0ABM8W1F0_GIGMA|nr:42835_t:CDS:2 [Gigaspora margarita]